MVIGCSWFGDDDVDGVHARIRALAETVAGFGLMSVPVWAHVMDDIIKGGQLITSVTGTIIGVYGVYRLFFRKKRRASDAIRVAVDG